METSSSIIGVDGGINGERSGNDSLLFFQIFMHADTLPLMPLSLLHRLHRKTYFISFLSLCRKKNVRLNPFSNNFWELIL